VYVCEYVHCVYVGWGMGREERMRQWALFNHSRWCRRGVVCLGPSHFTRSGGVTACEKVSDI